MKQHRFIWTREVYREAARLGRFFTHYQGELPPQPPALLQRYFDLWERHPQQPDPLLTPMLQRRHYEFGLDSIPF